MLRPLVAKSSGHITPEAVLGEVLESVCIHHGGEWIVPGQSLGIFYAGRVVLAFAIANETGSQVENHPGRRIETGIGDLPEGRTNVENSELMGH